MDDEIKDVLESEQHTDYKPSNRFDAAAVHHLSGMYQNWFLDYASYHTPLNEANGRRTL